MVIVRDGRHGGDTARTVAFAGGSGYNPSDLSEIVIELMISAGQPMQLRLRDRSRVQVDVIPRHGLIIEPVEQVHRHALRQPRTEVAGQVELVARPPAGANERGRDEHNHGKTRGWCNRGEIVGKDRSAHGMPDDNCVLVDCGEFVPDGSAPSCVARLVLLRQARVADLVAFAELNPQAVYSFASQSSCASAPPPWMNSTCRTDGTPDPPSVTGPPARRPLSFGARGSRQDVGVAPPGLPSRCSHTVSDA